MIRYYLLLLSFIGIQNQLFSQCRIPVINNPITLQYACRNVNISEISVNNTGNNVITNVEPKSKIHVSFKFNISQGCDYCPGCIVQLYWGIHNYHSNCFISFYGFDQDNVNNTNYTVLGDFRAPGKPGIYYITLGGTLDYSCKNSNDRPDCPKERAFAAIVVGNPVSTSSISIDASNDHTNSSITILKAETKGEGGCTGPFDSFEWYLNDSIIKDQKLNQISVTQTGFYKAVWYNCIREEVSATYNLKSPETNVPVLAEKNNILTIKAYVRDNSTKKVLLGTVFFEADGKPPEQVTINNDGVVLIPSFDKIDYRIHAKVDEYFGNDVLIKKEAFDSSYSIEREITMIPLKKGNHIILDNLLFLRGDFHLTDQSKKEINHLADMMHENKSMLIELDGHTDNVGDPQKDINLSLQRAEAVKFYLISKGIAAFRIETKGFGGKKPIASNTNEETRKLNRRVEMIIR